MVNSMLDLELFYEKTAKGENCDFLKMKDYLQSFSRIILWGEIGRASCRERVLAGV